MRRRFLLLLLPIAVCAAALLALYPFVPRPEATCDYTPPGHDAAVARFTTAAIVVHVAAFLVLLFLVARTANAGRDETGAQGPARWPMMIGWVYGVLAFVLAVISATVPFGVLIAGLVLTGLGVVVALPAFLLVLYLLLVGLSLGSGSFPEELRSEYTRHWYKRYSLFAMTAAFVLVPASLSYYLLAGSGPLCFG